MGDVSDATQPLRHHHHSVILPAAQSAPAPVIDYHQHLFSQAAAALVSGCCVGNAGHDVLKQGRGFTLDLSRMVLQVR